MNVDGKLLVGWQPWHTDFRWTAHPNHGGMLRVVKEPKSGGRTGFICMIDAYERLSDEMKQKLEGLEVEYHLFFDDDMFQFYKRENAHTVVEGTTYKNVRSRPKSDFPPVAHPLIRVQKETGRKMLYFSPLVASSVIGMDKEKSDELLFWLSEHITDPKNAYYHQWSPKDLVLWDNLRILHCATGVAPGEDREVWRTTISAPEATGRKLSEGGWSWEAARESTTA